MTANIVAPLLARCSDANGVAMRVDAGGRASLRLPLDAEGLPLRPNAPHLPHLLIKEIHLQSILILV